MKTISIFNDVLGPVMRGPSSSHTAASYNIGRVAYDLLGEKPLEAVFTFDPDGSYAKVYRQQGVDLAYAAALMGWQITDERFPRSLGMAAEKGIDIQFKIEKIPDADHPNTVEIRLKSQSGKKLFVSARSIGGGAVEFTRIEEWDIFLNGGFYDVIAVVEENRLTYVIDLLTEDNNTVGKPGKMEKDNKILVHVQRYEPLAEEVHMRLFSMKEVKDLWMTTPIAFVKRGSPLFTGAGEMVARADKKKCSLGEIAVEYESTLLGLQKEEILKEMERRFLIMQESVRLGLEENPPSMILLRPTAGKIFKAEKEGKVALGGLHTRAAARSIAALHVNNGMGVVCAAPTGGSAGVIPSVVATMKEEMGLSTDKILMSLFAMSAVGLITAIRATFAAEVAGCQVEIGAAGAMAAAGVVEAAGGTPQQAMDAAAIAYQNTMGSVCDLVQGVVEIPCHTRNAVAASNAFVCADLIMGGYENPVPLDETIDAVYSTGKMLPPELRCTALGGIAVTPSALAMKHLR